MVLKVILVSTFLVLLETEAFVRRDVSASTPTPPNILETFQKNVDEFRKCLDQTLANSVKEVNEKQLKPVLEQVGDSLNRVSKAFNDLTAPPPPKTSST